jgi:hypothetical protein
VCFLLGCCDVGIYGVPLQPVGLCGNMLTAHMTGVAPLAGYGTIHILTSIISMLHDCICYGVLNYALPPLIVF